MNTKMHGKLIDYIELNPAWTSHGNPESVGKYEPAVLHLSATHHGDHDQFWIVESKDGKEVARYNPRGVQHIRWSSDNG
jgi:hypothetical protein